MLRLPGIRHWNMRMNEQQKILFGKPRLLPIMFFGVALIYFMKQLVVAPNFSDNLILPGADDAMRLQSVRDMLAGQGWFDTRQYRVLPPEGISLHWSRLVDAPIAGLLSILEWVLDRDAAERLLVLLWPMTLFLLCAWTNMKVAREGFGVPAAVLTLVSLWFLQSYYTRYFPIGRLDHHNIQLVLMLAVFGLLLSRGWKAAALAGALAALSMAIGMESLPFLGIAGLVWVWRYLRCKPESEEALAAFGLTLGLTAVLLFVVQTDPALWGLRVCDQLSLPYLALVGSAAGLGLLILATRQHLLTMRSRALILLVTTIGLGILVVPTLAPCFGGPFADVSNDVRDQVITRIGESIPVAQMIRQAPAMAFVLMGPLAVVTFLSGAIWLREVAARRDPGHWGLLTLFLALGCVGAFLQLRAMIWGHAVMAVGFGAVMAHLLNRPWPIPRAVKVVAMIVFFAIVFLPQLVPLGIKSIKAALYDTGGATIQVDLVELDAACDQASLLRSLSDIPATLIASPLNLSTGILIHTAHSVTSAPYHRSTDAMLNGVLPFSGDMPELRRMIETTGAKFVLVCADQIYGTPDGAGSRLSAKQAPDWLVPVDTIAPPLLLYEVAE